MRKSKSLSAGSKNRVKLVLNNHRLKLFERKWVYVANSFLVVDLAFVLY